MIRKFFSGVLLEKITGKYLLFIGYIVLLFVIYIATRYRFENTIRDINRLNKEVTSLKSKSLKMKIKYQNTVSMRSVAEKLEGQNISESKEPVKDIIVIEE